MRFKNLLVLVVVNFGLLQNSAYADAVVSRPKSKCVTRAAYLATQTIDKATKRDTNIYVIDTNQFYDDPALLERLHDRIIVIPRSQIEEMDRHKKGFEERAQTARTVARRIRRLLNDSPTSTGIKLAGGGELSLIEVSESFRWPADLDPKKEKADHRLIALALELQQMNPGRKVVVVTGDNNMAILAKGLGLAIDEVKTTVDKRIVQEMSEAPLMLKSTPQMLDVVLDPKTTSISRAQAVEFGLPKKTQLHENQYIIFDGEDMLAGGQFNLDRAVGLVWRYSVKRQAFSPVSRRSIRNLVISPRNFEQVIAADLLLQEPIKLVTMSGKAGTGKTLITVATAMAQSGLFMTRPLFDKVILTRANEVVGKDIGYLPGTAREKTEPFVQPFRDNLIVFIEELRARNDIFIKQADANADRELARGLSMRDLLSDKFTPEEMADKIMKSTFVSVEPVAFSRGRSWKRTLLIIDEAQNLTQHEVKTIVTRAGEGTKVVLMGDLRQIDNRTLNHTNNGLMIAAARFRADDWYGHGHVSLIQGERSELATKASELLDD